MNAGIGKIVEVTGMRALSVFLRYKASPQRSSRQDAVRVNFPALGTLTSSDSCSAYRLTGVSHNTESSMGLFSKDIKTFDDLFVHQLQDVYYAEQQLIKALPKMAEKATNKELRQGFLDHLEQTRGHVQRLEQVFKMHNAQQK